MPTAQSIPQSYKILNYGTFPEGDKFIEVNCIDYSMFCGLPGAMEYDGSVYALTGWNSDRQVACYKTNVLFGLARR